MLLVLDQLVGNIPVGYKKVLVGVDKGVSERLSECPTVDLAPVFTVVRFGRYV